MIVNAIEWRRLALAMAASTAMAACTGAQATWTPTVDTYGSSQAQYLSMDLEECRALAMRTSGYAPNEAVSGAISGGLLGAAAGAAIGAALGDAGKGAAVGAATGGFGAATARGVGSEQQFKRAYVNCMRNRGHTVIN